MDASRPRSTRRSITLIAVLALAIQALLATWPTAADVGGPGPQQRGHDGHVAEHHAHDVASEPAAPPPSRGSDHHAKFCCILGAKLGIALALTPAWSFAEPSRRSDVATAPRAPGVLFVPLRPQGPFQARAPPLAA